MCSDIKRGAALSQEEGYSFGPIYNVASTLHVMGGFAHKWFKHLSEDLSNP